MKSREISIADNFTEMIKSLSDDVKLDIIKKIKKSLNKSKAASPDDSWSDLFGSFKSKKTADDIIKELKAERYSNRHIEDI
ncbi:hypothetical protein LVD17_27865 [Fulvivirga ulvae]|uniref:hypothetical protein n=1 Tax=Fulvivirga ulvae TaxID=2904245 RepID=UPI001F159187|nr:hypothetical protein [Fulvivirga ulvae]UII32105.1 hypothetical protein LVD17_27865 [Fulvivirga ulvae]